MHLSLLRQKRLWRQLKAAEKENRHFCTFYGQHSSLARQRGSYRSHIDKVGEHLILHGMKCNFFAQRRSVESNKQRSKLRNSLHLYSEWTTPPFILKLSASCSFFSGNVSSLNFYSHLFRTVGRDCIWCFEGKASANNWLCLARTQVMTSWRKKLWRPKCNCTIVSYCWKLHFHSPLHFPWCTVSTFDAQ